MARVYLAQDLTHGRPVAVKLLPPELASASNAERFLREIKITGALEHPNILPLFDSGVSGVSSGLYWYVMPYVEGQTLRDRLRDGPLELEAAFALAEQVGAALGHAHPRGIVHRDLKPENVMCSEGRYLVVDFGLARALDSASRLTGTGMPLGTPAYMSPEQILGAESVDARADLYSFGCVLYEAFTGRMPFTGKTVVHILQAQMASTAAPPSAVRPGIPPSVDRALKKVMAKEPRDRHQSAQELIDDLLRDRTPGATEPPPAEPARGLLSRWFGRK
jgi:eukaryotic-like serine/threonine-protein kinase